MNNLNSNCITKPIIIIILYDIKKFTKTRFIKTVYFRLVKIILNFKSIKLITIGNKNRATI